MSKDNDSITMPENIDHIDGVVLTYFKELYDGHNILYVVFNKTEFVFRTLTRQEYRFLAKAYTNKMDLQDAVCNTCCLYPESYEFATCGFAGLNEKIGDYIIDLSGFNDIDGVLAYYYKEKERESLEVQCMDLIKAFIPEYTYEEMEEWTWKKLMEMTVRAEAVATLKGFDWHIQDDSKEYKENMDKINSDNKEYIDKLIEHGVDPMIYFIDELKPTFKKEVLDFPIITSGRWNDEVVMNAVKEQIRKKEAKKLL